MKNLDATRRSFLAQCSALGVGGTLLPGLLWTDLQQSAATPIALDRLRAPTTMARLSFSEADEKWMLQAVNQSLTRITELRAIKIPNDVSPPFHFSALVPGMTVNRSKQPF